MNYRLAVKLLPVLKPIASRTAILAYLLDFLIRAFDKTGDASFLIKAITLEKEALRRQCGGRIDSSLNLSCRITTRCPDMTKSFTAVSIHLMDFLIHGFDQTGNASFLIEALALEKEALRRQGESRKYSSLGFYSKIETRCRKTMDTSAAVSTHLLDFLIYGFDNTGDTSFLIEAIILEESLRRPDQGSICSPVNLSSMIMAQSKKAEKSSTEALARCLEFLIVHGFERTGDASFLIEAITLEEQALQLLGESRINSSLDLSSRIMARCQDMTVFFTAVLAHHLDFLIHGFERTRDTSFLVEAITLENEALHRLGESRINASLSLCSRIIAGYKKNSPTSKCLCEFMILVEHYLPDNHPQRWQVLIWLGDLAVDLFNDMSRETVCLQQALPHQTSPMFATSSTSQSHVIVLLMVRDSRCYACIISYPFRVQPICLPNVTASDLSHLVPAIYAPCMRGMTADSDCQIERGAKLVRIPKRSPYFAMLARLWSDIVKPILLHMALPVRGYERNECALEY
jgi:hypothetical protein